MKLARRRLSLLLPKPEINKTCPTITPATTGSELSTNGGFEGIYVGGLAPSWTKSGLPTISESGDVHGGSAAQQFAASAANNYIYQATTAPAHAWYQLTCWGKRTAGTASDARLGANDTYTDVYGAFYTDAAYTQKLMTFLRKSNTPANFRIKPVVSTAGTGDTVIVDDVEFLAFNFSTLVTFIGSRSRQSGTYTCKPTVTAGTQCGILICAADEQNFVMAYVDRTRVSVEWAFLVKCVAGIYTQLTLGTLNTYVAEKLLQVVVNGTTYRLYYDGVQVGMDQTISNLGVGKKVYGFTTHPSNTVGLVTTTKKANGATPGVLIQFDDGKASSYSEGFSYMHAAGITGTSYVITNLLDTVGYITSAQAQEMYAAGWDIANHTTDHTSLAGLSEAAVATKTQGAQTALEALGLTRASRHVAYPGGGYNSTAMVYLANAGMLTGRTIEAVDICPRIMNNYRIPCRMTTNATTLADIQSWITTAIAAGKIVIILFHGLVAASPATYEWLISDFQNFIDWIVSQNITTYTISELYAMQ